MQLLFDRLAAKAKMHVGPGMVKYGWQDGPVFNLDDGEYLVWRPWDNGLGELGVGIVPEAGMVETEFMRL